VPWFTLSYADSITERGFKYTFQSSPVSSAQAEQALEQLVEIAKRNNQPIKKAAIIGDNTAATVFFFRPLREKLLKAKGIEVVVAAHPLKGQEELVKRFKERTGEPFMTQDPLMSYAHVWIIKEAAERAKSTDPKAIRDAVAKLDITSGPAATALAPGRIRYDE